VWLARPSALILNLAAAAVVLSVFAVAVVGGFASVASGGGIQRYPNCEPGHACVMDDARLDTTN
jgi:hypothetical protein